MKAAVLVSRKRIEIKDLPVPEPGAGEVLVRVGCAAICGTDHHIYLGEFEGRVDYPQVMGHEFGGVVEALGPPAGGHFGSIEYPEPGARVAVDPDIHCGVCPACREGLFSACKRLRLLGVDLPGAFAEYVLAPAASCHPLPDSIPDELAPMTELYGVACHSVGRSELGPGDFAAVMGAGRVGLVITDLLCCSFAAEVIAIDVEPSKLEVAKALGASHVINSREEDPVERVLGLTGGHGADRVYEAVGGWIEVEGRPNPMEQAFRMVRSGGRVTILGQGSEPASVLWRPFVWKEAEARTSRVNRGEFPRAIRLLAQGRFHPDRLVTHERPLEEAAEAFAILDDPRERPIKIRIRVTPSTEES